jgi:hypothetical protein
VQLGAKIQACRESCLTVFPGVAPQSVRGVLAACELDFQLKYDGASAPWPKSNAGRCRLAFLKGAGTMTEFETDGKAKPKCLDISSWRIATKEELRAFMDLDARARSKPSVLAVRHHLSPVDVYCYLKGRFGDPNGFQNFLRRDDSDNLIQLLS